VLVLFNANGRLDLTNSTAFILSIPKSIRAKHTKNGARPTPAIQELQFSLTMLYHFRKILDGGMEPSVK